MPFATLEKAKKGSRRHYRERQQLGRRAHLGHLEKHKDYVMRARDYQRKSAALKSLRRRALEKNPDEFYFHMTRSRLLEGRHSDLPKSMAKAAGAEKKLEDARIGRILVEDANYLRHKLQIERAKLAKLEAGGIAFTGAGADEADEAAGPRRTVFSKADYRRIKKDSAEIADGGKAWLEYLAGLGEAGVMRLAKERAKHLKEVETRMARVQAISAALAQLESKRHLAAEAGRPRKLMSDAAPADGSPAVWKFAFKRKR